MEPQPAQVAPLAGDDPDDEEDPAFRRHPVGRGARRRFARFGQVQFFLNIGTPWLSAYSYDYPSSCTYEPRLVTIKVPNGYGGYYFKKVWRDIRVCY